MINELKRKTISPLFTSDHQFGKINECMWLLVEGHKQSTLLRRHNVNICLMIHCTFFVLREQWRKDAQTLVCLRRIWAFRQIICSGTTRSCGEKSWNLVRERQKTGSGKRGAPYAGREEAAWGWDPGEQGFQEEEVRPRGGNPRTISSS